MTPHPYAEFLHLVEKPARYTGGEIGASPKDWAGVEATVCLAFPDVYDIGMSHLGYKILYSILNRDPRTLAERTYAPWPDMEAELRRRGLPLVSHETARPLRDFDVVGLSLQYELTYTNCLTILDLGGVPLRALDRGDDDPLVIGGGPTATHPEPMAIFFDAFVVGDGEDACRDVALAWARMKRAGVPRAARLVEIAKMPGLYVPSLYEVGVVDATGFEVVTGTRHPDVPARVTRTFLPDISKYPFPDDSPVGGPEAIFDRMSIEIARGCTEGCRFCQAGMIYRPVRERSPEEIVETVVSAVKKSGHDEVALTSLSTADGTCISPLIKRVVERLTPEKVSLSVASLRAYGLDEDLLGELRRVRASGLTFAPEAGTQRMRDVINKNVTEAQLLETAERVFKKGWDRMKLYFIVGLPTETDDDVRGILETGRRALDAGKQALREAGRHVGRASVTVSVSTHVPKPHTPFQWCAMDSLDEVRRKQALLRDGARQLKLDLRMHASDESVVEAIFARGDRRLGDVVEHAWRAGARFDSWEEHVRLDLWKAALAAHGVDVARYLGTVPVDARVPWDHIDVGLEDGFLLREYQKALRGRLSPPCGKAVGQFVHHTNVEEAAADRRRLVCYDCGVACDMTSMRTERVERLTQLGAARPGLPVVQLPPRETEEGKPHAPTKGATYRYRLVLQKLGPVAFLGHLDLVRALPRVFRRAEIPLAHTGGFNPKPDFTYGPALSLGVPSLGEPLDLKLTVELPPDELVARLDAVAPEGLRITGAARLGPEDPAIGKIVAEARYALAFAHKTLAAGPEAVRDAVERAMAAEALPVVRVIDGKQ
ncbi:MAG: TIGR03960 family B12-binding radical SAM protein, partial [Polyangiaceae bacterium]|nr:TIGR03960 family B12-binding radical SAM protein [Polyangiaceae bacterium]